MTVRKSYKPENARKTILGALYFSICLFVLKSIFMIPLMPFFAKATKEDMFTSNSFIMLSAFAVVTATLLSLRIVERTMKAVDFRYLPVLSLFIYAAFYIASEVSTDPSAIAVRSYMLWEFVALLAACSVVYYRRQI